MKSTPSETKMNQGILFSDNGLILTALLISVLGLVMVGSATSEIAVQKYGISIALVLRHSIYLVLALAGCLVLARVPFWYLMKLRLPMLVGSVILLLLVFVPGIGNEVNGARRWLSFSGFSLQPSEIAKIALILYLSVLLGKLPRESMNLSGLLPAIIVVVILASLILIEPDFGTTLILCASCFGMMYVAGMQYRLVLLGIVISVACFAFLLYLQPYRVERFEAVLNPWEHAFGSGYQVTQALMAIGRGGWFGVGLGKSVQKFFYLPEAHTDFLIAVTIEELGLITALILLMFYALLILKIAGIARRVSDSGDRIAALFVYGVYFYFCFQSAVAWGVNLTLLPTTGISLPLFSYGGSSLIVSYAMLGITQSIARAQRQGTIKHRPSRLSTKHA